MEKNHKPFLKKNGAFAYCLFLRNQILSLNLYCMQSSFVEILNQICGIMSQKYNQFTASIGQ